MISLVFQLAPIYPHESLEDKVDGRRAGQKDVTAEDTGGMTAWEGLDPLLLTLKMEDGSHEPRNVGDL